MPQTDEATRQGILAVMQAVENSLEVNRALLGMIADGPAARLLREQGTQCRRLLVKCRVVLMEIGVTE